jgi:hypothetical protein
MRYGWCKYCIGAPVLIPAILVSCETVNPTYLPMRAGAKLGAGFALVTHFLLLVIACLCNLKFL